MKIVDLRCAVIGKNPIVRLVTDEGLSGYGEVEQYKPYLKPFVLYLREALIGEDPTLVERVMLKIRQRGAFKPYGSAVSAIEMALWDLAGKAAGLPVHRLLGGKIRDRVRVYNGALRKPLAGQTPKHYADEMRRMKALPEGFTIVKQGIAFHSPMKHEVPDFDLRRDGAEHLPRLDRPRAPDRARAGPRAGVRRRDEGGARRRGRTRARLRAGMDAARRHPLRPRGGEAQPDVARGHAHRRLHPLRQRRRLRRGHPRHLDADPHRRADLPAAELQGPDRAARRARDRSRPVRRRRHRRAQVDRRVRRPPRHPHGAARNGERAARPGRPGAGQSRPCRRTSSPSSTRPATRRGGTTSSTGCRPRS